MPNVSWTTIAAINAAGIRLRHRSSTGGSGRSPTTTSPRTLKANAPAPNRNTSAQLMGEHRPEPLPRRTGWVRPPEGTGSGSRRSSHRARAVNRPRLSRSNGHSMATKPAGNAASSPNLVGSIAEPTRAPSNVAVFQKQVHADPRDPEGGALGLRIVLSGRHRRRFVDRELCTRSVVGRAGRAGDEPSPTRTRRCGPPTAARRPGPTPSNHPPPPRRSRRTATLR